MSFTPDQIKALEAHLNSKHVKSRKQAGRDLSYVEGWWAIAEANRIFGFDRWHRETIEMRQLGDPREVDGKWRVAYMAKVRVEVLPGDRCIIREGTGYGSGIDRDMGQSHESAIKEAETDAMKRALMTFGNPFGLALYDKEQNGVEHEKPSPPSEMQSNVAPVNRAAEWALKAEKEIGAIHSRAGMSEWSRKNAAAIDKMRDTDKALWNAINLKIALRNDELEAIAA